MSPIPTKKDKNGKPQLAGTWTVLLMLLLTASMIGLGSMMQQQRTQAMLAAQQWKAEPASGRKLGFRLEAQTTTFKLELEQAMAASPDGVDPHKGRALVPTVLESVRIGDGEAMVAFVSERAADDLAIETEESVWRGELNTASPAASATTTVVLAGNPATVLPRVEIVAIDRQGLPNAPRTTRVEPDGHVATYEFRGVEPAGIDFLRLTLLDEPDAEAMASIEEGAPESRPATD